MEKNGNPRNQLWEKNQAGNKNIFIFGLGKKSFWKSCFVSEMRGGEREIDRERKGERERWKEREIRKKSTKKLSRSDVVGATFIACLTHPSKSQKISSPCFFFPY